jgi:ketosteroid isomerase-like protein
MSNDTTILQQLMDAYNAHDADAVVSCFTDDAVFESPAGIAPEGTSYVGKDAIRAAVAARFESSPDVRWDGEGHFRDGDRGASSWTVSWTNLDGSVERHRGCDLFTLRGELLTRKDSFFKTALATG